MKLDTDHTNEISDKVIMPTHTVFTPRWHVLEGVVIWHEIIHKLHSKNFFMVIFKIN
jgi:hypothetical protein